MRIKFIKYTEQKFPSDPLAHALSLNLDTMSPSWPVNGPQARIGTGCPEWSLIFAGVA